MSESSQRLEEMRARSLQAGGPERIAKQHQKGKLSARERVELLADPGSFVEIDRFVLHRCRDFGMDAESPSKFSVTNRVRDGVNLLARSL